MTNTDIINQKSPLGKTAVLGFQHVLVMYSAAVIVPILLGSALNLNAKDLAFLISADLFTCGIATLLQVIGIGKFIGIKLPVVLGCAVITLGPMISIGKADGLPAVYGAIMVSGIFVFLISFVIDKIMPFFPKIVTGSLVTIIGFSLVPIALRDFGGGYSDSFGEPKNILLGLFVLVLIILINRFFTGFIRAIAVLIGIVAGTIAATFLGMVSFDSVRQAEIFHFVTPFYFGMPKFTLNGVLTMCLFLLINIVESVGIFTVISDICETKLDTEDYAKGIRAEAAAQVLGGFFNSFPYVTFSENAGVMTITGVRNRYPVAAAGIILIILGVIPKFAALATIIPAPVLGGATIAIFGTIGANGIKLLSQVDLSKSNNLLIIAASVGLGIGTTVMPDLFTKLPELVSLLFGNGIFTGTLTAIVLNILFNYDEIKEQRALIKQGLGGMAKK